MSLDSLACGHDNVKQSKIVALTVSLGRKNFLFFGSDHGGERGALLYSLIGTCKLNDVDPESYRSGGKSGLGNGFRGHRRVTYQAVRTFNLSSGVG
ncbi:hypothetical protein EA188_17090 [Escherichia coli]|nr:hypothetical protein EA188_17090 [Escherichia coli]